MACVYASNQVVVKPDALNCLPGMETLLIAPAAGSHAKSGRWLIVGAVSAALLFAVGLLWGCGGDAHPVATAPPPVATPNSPAPASEPTSPTAAAPRDLDIVTLLEFDAIKAIDNPEFLSPEEVGDTYRPNEKVIGVSIDGDNRAYSVPMLSRHEIVNDTVGGVKIAVTW